MLCEKQSIIQGGNSMNDYRAYVTMNYNAIYHHGIKGQQWGVQNGPPYPLDYERHSPKELRKTGGNFSDGSTGSIKPVKNKSADIPAKKESTLKKMAKYAWRDRKSILKDEIKGAAAIAGYKYGSKAASAAIARAGWNIAYKNRNIPVSHIASNVIDKSRPLVLGLMGAAGTISAFKKIKEYRDEAKGIKKKKK